MVRGEAGASVPASRKASEIIQGEQGDEDWSTKADSGAPVPLHIPFQPNRTRTLQPGYKI